MSGDGKRSLDASGSGAGHGGASSDGNGRPETSGSGAGYGGANSDGNGRPEASGSSAGYGGMSGARYKGRAETPDGICVSVEGTIQQVACWAENVIRSRDEDVTIFVERIEDGAEGG